MTKKLLSKKKNNDNDENIINRANKKQPKLSKVKSIIAPQIELSERSKALEVVTKDIKNIITADIKQEVIYVPTKIVSLNRAIVCGGWPLGTIAELHGPNGGGKTAEGVIILKSFDEAGHLTMMCDAERAANDKKWLRDGLGLNLKTCMYFNPKCFEDAAEKINKAIINFREGQRKGLIHKEMCLAILVDSVAKLTPEAELKNKVGKQNYGLLSNLMSQWLRQLTILVGDENEEKSRVTIIFVNQERRNVNAEHWEPQWKSFGGDALQFDAHVRMRVQRKSYLTKDVKGGKVKFGKEHKIHVEKNKIGYPETDCLFYTCNGEYGEPYGFDRVRTAVEEAKFRGLFEDGYVFGEYKFKHESRLITALREDEEALKALEDSLNSQI